MKASRTNVIVAGVEKEALAERLIFGQVWIGANPRNLLNTGIPQQCSQPTRPYIYRDFIFFVLLLSMLFIRNLLRISFNLK